MGRERTLVARKDMSDCPFGEGQKAIDTLKTEVKEGNLTDHEVACKGCTYLVRYYHDQVHSQTCGKTIPPEGGPL